MPPQKGLANVTKSIVFALMLFVVIAGGAIFYFKNLPTEQVANVSLKQTKKPVITLLSGEKQRDFQRIIDIKRLQTSLQAYYDQCGGYPPVSKIVVPGSPSFDASFRVGCPKGTSFGTISGPIPANPAPGGADYQYCSERVSGSGECGIPIKGKAEGYILTFKLEGGVDATLTAGVHTATPKGIK